MSLEAFNTLVGVAGLLLAIWAIVQARSARAEASAARKAVMDRRNTQDDIERIAPTATAGRARLKPHDRKFRHRHAFSR